MRFGETMNTTKRQTRKIVSKATLADGLVCCAAEDSIYLVLLRNGKPIAKVEADWAFSCMNNYIDDVEAMMQADGATKN